MADVLTPGPVTPPPAIAMATALHEVMTPMIMLKDSGTSGALIGGMVGSVLLLLLICIMVVLIWISFRQKGSYVTNEFNEEEEGEESDAADMEQQSKKPLTAEEHE